MTNNTNIWRAVILSILALLLTACGAQPKRGFSPQVAINLATLQESELALEFRIRNINEVPLAISSMPYTLEVQDEEFAEGGSALSLTVGASGAEIGRETLAIPEARLKPFSDLDAGTINSLPYSLKGEILTDEGKRLEFEFDGHLFPVPGRRNQFR